MRQCCFYWAGALRYGSRRSADGVLDICEEELILVEKSYVFPGRVSKRDGSAVAAARFAVEPCPELSIT